jgi:hypothetical protein
MKKQPLVEYLNEKLRQEGVKGTVDYLIQDEIQISCSMKELDKITSIMKLIYFGEK